MTVQGLIDALDKVTDKNKQVLFLNEDEQALHCETPFEYVELQNNCYVITKDYHANTNHIR